MTKKSTATAQRLEQIEARLVKLEEMISSRVVVLPPSLPRLRPFAVLGSSSLNSSSELLALSPEVKEQRRRLRETPVEPWRHLVLRQHPWRKQLSLTGRNMTARQLVGSLKANGFDEQQAAANYRLPVEAIREAIAYVEQNQVLLQTEAEIERLMLKRGQEGMARGPQPLS
jgi:uncharacterized protein (DUF433 family)